MSRGYCIVCEPEMVVIYRHGVALTAARSLADAVRNVRLARKAGQL